MSGSIRQRAETQLAGWINRETNVWWPLPPGHKPPEYQVDLMWEPVYRLVLDPAASGSGGAQTTPEAP